MQNNMSIWPVIDRIGRWNGSTFESVTPGSISTGTVIAMSHGWSPGFEDLYAQLQAEQSSLVTFWDPKLAAPNSDAPVGERFETLAESLQAADPDATILMYSWIDQSATGANPFQAVVGERATEINGHRLATALSLLLTPDFVTNGGDVHLIGHSFGANVATTAALSLPIQPRQLTLFDSPETDLARFGGAANTLRYKLTRLTIGRSETEVFVDNYVSDVGLPYGPDPGLATIVDTQLAPPTGSNAADRHEFPIAWYATSARDATPGVGYWWSPLAGGQPSRLGSAYEQPSPEDALALVQTASPPDPSVTRAVAYQSTPLVITGTSDVNSKDGSIELSGTGVTTASIEFETTDNSLWLTFDIELTSTNDDTISLFVDGRQRWIGAGRDVGARPSGSFVVLYDLDPGVHTLSVVLGDSTVTGAPASSTTARLGGLSVVTTTDIERNANVEDSRNIILWLVGLTLVIAIALFVLVVLIIIWAIRAVRRRGGAPG
jgi:pimeloyl-ACP methyl ester carboxylesterase